jgi:hypothetical protein
VADHVRTMEPAEAGAKLAKALGDGSRPVTVADASTASGLALRDAEVGLAWLTSEYRGHLRVTEDGDLIHVFPHGFNKPWETKEAAERFFAAVGRALLAAGRFLVRAWLLIAMVGYALLFIGVMIALTLSRGSNDDRNSPGLSILGGLLRMIADAMFWTFHPFSPLYVDPIPMRGRQRRRAKEDDVRFYEKVNRFVFGPERRTEDPNAMRARILEEIRARKGRIGLADVMRVSGLPREQADPLMARLMLDHDGTVDVAEQGGIVYRFEAMRRTAEAAPQHAPTPQRPAWESPQKLGPLTGNNGGANAAIVALNGFNLLASLWAMSNGLTLTNLAVLLSKHPPGVPIVLPDTSLPLVLGVVPLVFSVALFAIPALRALARTREAKRVAQENARLAIMREVLTRAPKKEPVPDEALKSAYRIATGSEPSSADITKRVVELGGDVDPGPDGAIRYRFADLEAEAEALEDERAHAANDEANVGRVIFASDA